jgi:hypothetical protein
MSCEADTPPKMSEDFRRKVAGLSVRELRRRFPAEKRHHDRILRDAANDPDRNAVHPEFRSFKSFLMHLGQRPGPNHTVDRIDVYDPEYGPGKCQWKTPAEQANNRTTTIFLTHPDGRRKPLTEWAKITRQSAALMRQHKVRRWSDAEIIAGRREGSLLPTAASSLRHNNPWPEGISAETREKWASAYQIFQKVHLDPAARKSATKALFAAWRLSSMLVGQERRVHRIFPDWSEEPGSGPDGNPVEVAPLPPGLLEHEEWRRLTSMRAAQANALAMLRDDQRRVLRDLRTAAFLNPVRRRLGLPLVSE